MPNPTWGMIMAGTVALLTGSFLIQPRFRAASGSRKIVLLGPLCEAVALTIFAFEHFLDAKDLAPIVPRWLPFPLFWTYLVGVALLAAAISFLAWRSVRWSALLLALLFVIIVVTVDLPNLPKHIPTLSNLIPDLVRDRLFWTLTVRELCFAAGAMVLAGSQWPTNRPSASILRVGGRLIVAAIFVLYAIEHFLFPRFVPGVPLEKLTPAWMPAPLLIAYFVGLTLLVAGIGLLFPRTRSIAAASAGTVLLLLTAFFYIPILVFEINSPLALEGINYVGDTLLFASTALLAGFDSTLREQPLPLLGSKPLSHGF